MNSFLSSTAPAPLAPAPPWRVGPALWDFQSPLLMGVLNITPDSFSDGGRYLDPGLALAHAARMEAQGAGVIDVGAVSSRPGAPQVDEGEERARLGGLLPRLVEALGVPVSLDTANPQVALYGLEQGVAVINYTGGQPPAGLCRAVGRAGAVLVLMHRPEQPVAPGRLLEELLAFFERQTQWAGGHGAEKLVWDPGYGFGKSLAQNLALLGRLPQLAALGHPLLVGVSRKGSLGQLAGVERPEERLGASLAAGLFAAAHGAHLLRVHDVEPHRQALAVWRALQTAEEG